VTPRFDSIVIGAGGFGSAAVDHLAARGASVLGIEQHGIAHDLGSSHGHTRVIRQAYFEHPDYVPLLQAAYSLWDELALDSGQDLIDRCGLLLAGLPDGPAVSGTRIAAKQHGLELQDLSRHDLESGFSRFQVPAHFDAVWEAEGGHLFVEQAVAAHLRRAESRGAVLQTEETVIDWQPSGSGFEVTTDKGRYSAGSLVITPGSWAPQLMPGIKVAWDIVRKPLFWFPTSGRHHHREQGAGVFFLETPGGEFYGFPSLDGETVKLAEHTGGLSIEDPVGVDRGILNIDLPPVVEFLEAHMPDLFPTPSKHTVCLYTRTPDGHFIVDRHPEHDAIALGCGFSGHGFKFTPVIGQVLAELALEGQTRFDIEFLSLLRPGLLWHD